MTLGLPAHDSYSLWWCPKNNLPDGSSRRGSLSSTSCFASSIECSSANGGIEVVSPDYDRQGRHSYGSSPLGPTIGGRQLTFGRFAVPIASVRWRNRRIYRLITGVCHWHGLLFLDGSASTNVAAGEVPTLVSLLGFRMYVCKDIRVVTMINGAWTRNASIA